MRSSRGAVLSRETRAYLQPVEKLATYLRAGIVTTPSGGIFYWPIYDTKHYSATGEVSSHEWSQCNHSVGASV